MLASVTCLKPFLRPFHSGYFVSTAPSNGISGYTTGPKNSRADAYYELSAARSRTDGDKKHSVIVQTRNLEDDRGDRDLIEPCAKPQLAFRPDRCEHRATALPGGGGHGVDKGEKYAHLQNASLDCEL